MQQYPAPPILRRWHQHPTKIFLLIPGGWLMNLPSFTIDQSFDAAYIAHHRKKGLSFERARQAVDKMVQETAAAGFRASLLASITYFAKLYAEMYPERLQPALLPGKRKIYTPAGYDPGRIQKIHVPGTRPGKEVKRAKEMMREMTP